MFEKESFYHLLPPDTMEVCEEHFQEFFQTMFDRQRIWFERNVNKSPREEWSKDEILLNNKFTNVYRELDRSSIWIIRNIILNEEFDGFCSDRKLKRNMLWKLLVARLINNPVTLSFVPSEHTLFTEFVDPADGVTKPLISASEMGISGIPHVDEYDPEKMRQFLMGIKVLGMNPYTNAYYVRSEVGFERNESFAYVSFRYINDNIDRILDAIENAKKPTDVIKKLNELPCVSSFLTHEFYQDLTYIKRYRGESFFKFNQDDFTSVGPGASTGIRLIYPYLKTIREQKKAIYWLKDIALRELDKIAKERGVPFPFISVVPRSGSIIANDLPHDDLKTKIEEGAFDDVDNPYQISLHQIEMWLCEYQKYWKVKNSIGRQRSKFHLSHNKTKLLTDEDIILTSSY
nr:MAG TPA: Pplase1 alpha-glutamyl/putrescinyl thymine pyrophosphorylase clade 1 [Caudoviricetes sp.]